MENHTYVISETENYESRNQPTEAHSIFCNVSHT